MAMTEFLVRVRTTVPGDLSLEAWREVVAAERAEALSSATRE